MGQARFPLESLAVVPIIHGLTFIFRAGGLSYLEVVIALLGPRREHFAQSLAGRVVGVSWLVAPCVRVLRTGPATETSAQDESDTASTEAIG